MNPWIEPLIVLLSEYFLHQILVHSSYSSSGRFTPWSDHRPTLLLDLDHRPTPLVHYTWLDGSPWLRGLLPDVLEAPSHRRGHLPPLLLLLQGVQGRREGGPEGGHAVVGGLHVVENLEPTGSVLGPSNHTCGVEIYELECTLNILRIWKMIQQWFRIPSFFICIQICF